MDARVCHQVYKRAIKTFLADKTVILATHRLSLITNADQVLCLDEGKQKFFGKYEDFKKVDFTLIKPESSTQISTKRESKVAHRIKPKLKEEEVKYGNVGFSVYWRYLKSGRLFVCTLTVIFLLAGFAYNTYNNYNLLENIRQSNSTKGMDMNQAYFFLGNIFVVWITFALGLISMSSFTTTASRNLHNKLFQKIMTAHCRIFDENSTGQIVNRFSRDLGFIDNLLPHLVYEIHTVFMGILTAIGFTFYVIPYVVIICFFLSLLLIYVVYYVIRTTRHTRRLEAAARSPLYSAISDTLHGLRTIRTLGVSDKYLAKVQRLSEEHTKAWYMFTCSFRWMGIRLSWILAVFLLLSNLLCISLSSSVSPTLMGLAIVNIMSMLEPFEYFFRVMTEFENAVSLKNDNQFL